MSGVRPARSVTGPTTSSAIPIPSVAAETLSALAGGGEVEVGGQLGQHGLGRVQLGERCDPGREE